MEIVISMQTQARKTSVLESVFGLFSRNSKLPVLKSLARLAVNFRPCPSAKVRVIYQPYRS